MPGQRFVFLVSVLVFLAVVGLVRNRKLSEKLSLFWLTFAALTMMGSSLGFPYLLRIASWIGIVYPPSALFLLAVIFLLAFTLYLSIAIFTVNEQNRLLAQELALLRLRMDETFRRIPPAVVGPFPGA